MLSELENKLSIYRRIIRDLHMINEEKDKKMHELKSLCRLSRNVINFYSDKENWEQDMFTPGKAFSKIEFDEGYKAKKACQVFSYYFQENQG